ncbi:MAG: gliding motility-associated C-terminal domain-containing protein [Bacteroidota bacterium]
MSVTDANGCKDQSQVRIFVKNQIFIPELFTPNDDGANDVFLIYGDGIQEIALRIYDTSGNLLYETDDPQTAQFSGWDGKSNGQTLPDGNYIWTIEGKYFNGSSVEFNGKNKGVIRLIK